jgi:hypothetical protein
MKNEPLDRISGKKLILCLPGEVYSGDFLSNLFGFITTLIAKDCNVMMAQTGSSCIHRLRNACGGGHPLEGILQTPFKRDRVDYDYILWIDSDIIFTFNDFNKLLEVDKEVATGWYYDKDGNPACGFIEKTVNKYRKKKSDPVLNHPLYDKDKIYEFKFDEDITEKTDPYPIDWCGMGWMLIKKGVMEKVQYPWFAPRNVRVSENLIDCLSEDISFQINLQEAGVEVWMHPGARVGHEKTRVL